MNALAHPPRPPRFGVSLPARLVALREGSRGDAEVLNLSERGLALRSDVRLALGVPVGIKIDATAERGRIDLFGYVRWVAGGNVGVEVRGMIPRHRSRFDTLLAGLREESSVNAPFDA